MAQNTTTAITIAAAGALSKFILDRDFTWKAATLISVGAVGGFFIALALIELVPTFSNASDGVKYSVMYFCGMFFPSLVRRIDRATYKVNFGMLSIRSERENKNDE